MTRVALITGGSKRIGAEIARALHSCGYAVAIHYRNSGTEAGQLSQALNKQRPNSAAIFNGDLARPEDIERLVDNVLQRWQHLDALVNNASAFYPTPMGSVTEDNWDDLLDSNVKGAFFLSQSLGAALTDARGAIVNISDINARSPLRNYPAYSIAKAGVSMLTKSLALELSPLVRVNGIAPGSILPPASQNQMSAQNEAHLLKKIPLGRMGTPRDIANLAVFLINNARYITGQTIAVDGGLSLAGSLI